MGGGSGGPGHNTIEVTDLGQTATLNATIVGNPGVGVTKTGLGTLVLGGVNTYTGPTTVNDVLLTAAAPIPEPSCLHLMAVSAVLLLSVSLGRAARRACPAAFFC